MLLKRTENDKSRFEFVRDCFICDEDCWAYVILTRLGRSSIDQGLFAYTDKGVSLTLKGAVKWAEVRGDDPR